MAPKKTPLKTKGAEVFWELCFFQFGNYCFLCFQLEVETFQVGKSPFSIGNTSTHS